MFRFRIAWRHNVRPILIVAAGWIAVHVHVHTENFVWIDKKYVTSV
jgi:hypothetical protein